MKTAYKLASTSASKNQLRQKSGYDLRTKGAVLDIGDKVLVKIVAWDGKHKLTDKWEEDTYVVLKQPF